MATKKTTTKKAAKAKPAAAPKQEKPSMALAIVALVLNILILPGLGTLIGGGKKKDGIIQIVMAVVGVPLSILIIGIPIILAAWIWGIVSGVNLIKAAEK